MTTRRPRKASFVAAVASVALTTVLVGPSTGQGADRQLSSSGTGMCGSLAGTSPPATFSHVIWIWMENHSYPQIVGPPGSPAAMRSPYVNGTLVPSCGLASNYHSLSHPSLPNYIGATSGDTQGLTGNCAPAKCPQSAPSLFAQTISAGKTWRSYAESMPSNCFQSNTSLYETPHNAAVYYTDSSSQCPNRDIPLGTPSSGNFIGDLTNNTLPSFSFVIPNECNNDGCSIATGDTWLSTWVPLITGTSAYRSGNTALFITWDEGAGGSKGEKCLTNLSDSSCQVATLVVSPYTAPGTLSSTLYSHYSLLRTTEDMLALPRLGHAADSTTNSLVGDFFGSGTGHGQPPMITSFSPSAGRVGARVTIIGSSFTGATSVQLGSARALFSVAGDTRIIATVPSIPAGLYTWSVTTASGTGTSSSKFHVF